MRSESCPIRKLIPFLCFLSLLASQESPAKNSIPPQSRIAAAYQNERGELIVDLESDPESRTGALVAGNTLFWGTPGGGLHQLELLHDNQGSELRMVTFQTNEPTSVPREINLGTESASVFCKGGTRAFTPLSAAEKESLETAIRSGKLALHMLPRTYHLRFLFRVSGSSEYIHITEPHFNFHNNYEIFIGEPGNWRRIRTLATPLPSDGEESNAGRIVFASGGGIYIPLVFDLFSRATAQRGAPTLIRAAGAQVEALIPVRLSPRDLGRFKIRNLARPKIQTPCDSHSTNASS